MIETQFDGDEWVGRLGASLEAITASVEFSLRLEGGHSPYLTYDNVRALHKDASHRPAIRDAMVSSSVRLNSDLTEQRAILRDHPVLRRALKGTGEAEGLMFLNPGRAFRVSSKGLVLDLLRLSATSTGAEAARLLYRYVTDGESRKLEGREFVVIYGLKIAGRIDLGNGSFLAPLDAQLISQEGFTREEADKLKTFGVAGRDFRDDSGGSSVFVRDLDWGPGVAPASDGYEVDHAEIAYRFPCDVETVTNLLSVAAHCPLATSTRHVRVAKWMHDIDANFVFGGWQGGGFRFDGWWEECELPSEAEADFKRSIAGWAGFQFKSDVERDALTLAAWRLSGSFTRIGRWQLQDRILDYAIALEILYRLDSSELTYKLGTRAACLLGKTPEERRATFDKITEFYDVRSAIVHGPTKKKHRSLRLEHLERVCTDGRDLACDTLSELLQNGCFPDWKSLVLEGPTAPVAHRGSGADYPGDG